MPSCAIKQLQEISLWRGGYQSPEKTSLRSNSGTGTDERTNFASVHADWNINSTWTILSDNSEIFARDTPNSRERAGNPTSDILQKNSLEPKLKSSPWRTWRISAKPMVTAKISRPLFGMRPSVFRWFLPSCKISPAERDANSVRLLFSPCGYACRKKAKNKTREEVESRRVVMV